MKKLVAMFVAFIAVVSVANAQDITLSGSVISDNQKMITSRYMGFVTQVNVSEGDRVKRGDLLYTIDSKEIDSMASQVKLAISQAELALEMHKNKLNNVQMNLSRYRHLYQKDIVSKYDVENLELAVKNLTAMVDIAKKQVAQAKQRLKEVQNQYTYLNIKAPNSGVVISKNIKVGEMAMPAMPAMVLADLKDLKVVIEISEKDLKRVSYGKKVLLEIPSINYKGIGKVSAIIPSSNPMTHTFKIKVSFKAKHFQVYPGMYAIIKL